MKITKKNGNVVLFDDAKVINSILKANAQTRAESLSRKEAVVIADEVFDRLTEKSEIISTSDVRDSVATLLREKGFVKTAELYLSYKKK